MRLSINNLQERLEILDDIIAEKRRALRNAPNGSIRIANDKRGPRFYHITDPKRSRGKYISINEVDLIRQLIQKDYDFKVLERAIKERTCILHLIGRYRKGTAEDVFDKLIPERRRLITPIILPDDEYVQKWLNRPYEGLGFKDTDPFIENDRGLRVRSKSEVIISNRYDARGVPNRYEEPLFLKGYGKVYPDFRLLNVRTRKEFIHEHLGMMDDPAYAEDNIIKIKAYQYNGWILGENLIITMETKNSPINAKDIDLIIDNYLL